MDTLTGLYLLLQLDSIKEFIAHVAAFFTVITIIGVIIYAFWYVVAILEKKSLPPHKVTILLSIIAIMSFLLNTINAALPTTERAAMMVVGAKIIDSNTTSILSQIPEKYAKILEQKADAYMKEMEKQ